MTDEPRAIPDAELAATAPEPPRMPRSQRIGIASVLVIVAIVGLAAGAGVTPGDAKEALLQRIFGDPEPQIDRARLVASDSAGTSRIEVSLAPTDRGPGECIVIRTESSGPAADGSTGLASQRVRCWFDGPAVEWNDPAFRIVRPADRFGLLMEAPIGPPGDDAAAVALAGAVHDDVESITAEFGDGAQYTFNVVTQDGWFAVILPDAVADLDRVDGTLVNPVVSLKLFDADGRVVATISPVPIEP